jgi:hypothetical protein
MTSEPDTAADADIIAPDGETAPEPVRPAPGPRLGARRFVGALALTSVLYFFIMVALASLGGGSLSLVAALLFAVWAGRRLTGIRGWRPWLAIAVGAFFLVDVLAYVVIVTWLAASGSLPAGG